MASIPLSDRPAVTPQTATTLAQIAAVLAGPAEGYTVATPRQVAADLLDLAPERLLAIRTDVTYPDLLQIGCYLRDRLDLHAPLGGGGHFNPEPFWEVLDLGKGGHLVPVGITARAWIDGDVPVVVRLDRQHHDGQFEVLLRPEHEAVAVTWHRQVCAEATGSHSPYRGRQVRLRLTEQHEVRADVTRVPRTTRQDVILPDRTWRLLDRHVLAPLRHASALRGMGLGANRGVLLHGPPGTGKTAVSRVLAGDVPAGTTVLLVDPGAAGRRAGTVYTLASQWAPTLVVLEDIDLIAGRGGRVGQELHDFLVALDGLLTDADAGVVTLASTNDSAALDAAGTRAARFDLIVEMPPPGLQARRRILERYLAALDHGVDIPAIAGLTEGATGADLRELIRRAVLEEGPGVTTARLRRLVAEASFRPVAVGAYL